MTNWKNILKNCRQATLLIIKRSEHKLTRGERLKLFIHLLLCDPCRQFEKQSEMIDHLLKHHTTTFNTDPPYQLREETRKKMKAVIESNL